MPTKNSQYLKGWEHEQFAYKKQGDFEKEMKNFECKYMKILHSLPWHKYGSL